MRSKAYNSSKLATLVWLLAMIFSCSLQNADAAQMSDYCITPPYIGASLEPNLLLMIDNSASMYDLNYTDTTHKYCANATTTLCTTDANCSSAGTAYCLSSATTTTTTTTTKYPCTQNSHCPSFFSDPVAANGCNTGLGVCKNPADDQTTTTVVVTPITCTQDTDCTIISGDTCNNKCNVTHSCYDDTYDNITKVCSVTGTTSCSSNVDCPPSEQCLGKYDGYFDRSATYNYSSGVFTSGATMPGSCTYSAGTPMYVCLSTSLSGTYTTVSEFKATGNFLNWLTMSKFDIEKKILTGGKYDGANLIAETRGCSGRKYIKVVNDGNMGSNVTFAIRGRSGAGIQTIMSQATEFGQTHIEIYGGQYNAAACVASLNDWMNVNSTQLGTLQGDTKCCLTPGTSTSGCNPTSTLDVANQSIHDCFWYYNGHGLSNMQPIQNNCVSDWGIKSAASITTQAASDAICSSKLPHPASLVWPSGSTNTSNGMDAYTTGYLGLCYNVDDGKWDAAGGFDADCSLKEQKDFCAGLGGTASVTDPSTSIPPDELQNVPGFVMELGLAALTSIGTATVQVALATPPTGLINKYQGLIRFGAMTFQNNGSLSECDQNGHCSITTSTSCTSDAMCGGEKCVYSIPCIKVCQSEPTRQCFQPSDCTNNDCTSLGSSGLNLNADGGKFLSTSTDANAGYVGHGACSVTTSTICDVDSECTGTETCMATVGSHSSGLIQSIDNVVASSWTPFAEGFYNAMGYFARSNSYPSPPAKDTPTSKNFNFTIAPGATPASLLYNTNKNPSQLACQKNNVLLITDGMSTADLNAQETGMGGFYQALVTSNVGTALPTDYNKTPPCNYSGSTNLPVLTWLARNRNIKNTNLDGATPLVSGDIQKVCTDDFSHACSSDADCTNGTCTNLPTRSSESINTYVVYTGPSTTTSNTLCDPLTLVSAAAKNGGTTAFLASNGSLLESTLANAFDQVAARAAAGTAASVLASGEGSGANLIQAVFYPHKRFAYQSGLYDEISWIGKLTNLWFYVDPFLGSSSIREDNGCATCTLTQTNPTPGNGNKTLDLLASSTTTSGDYVINMFYDPTEAATKAHRWTDPNGTGVIGTQLPDIGFEDLGYLWEAGTFLWKRDLSTSPRTIKTSVGAGLIDFSVASLVTYPTLSTYMEAGSTTADLITWVTGSDVSASFRSRSVKIESIDQTPRVWKLGDVVNSTPKLMSWTSLNNYGLRYGDTTYGTSGDADSSHFVTTSDYKNRGVVFAGGNDGMLHAFKLGTLQLSWTGRSSTQKARMVVDSTSNTLCSAGTTTIAPTCGQEIWAFIPKNVLPYLKYTANPNYCHINSVDLTPFIFDASIGSATDTADTPRTPGMWRTVLIGGMRFGGACKSFTDTCTSPGSCVKNPVNNVGYSSYFAIDITDPDPNNWSLLWEFSDQNLGFTTSGPAVIRINGSDQLKNGNWFVVFGSGPTGPISTSDHQFLGQSDQPLRLFVLDLKTGVVLRTIGPTDINIPDAFAGSLLGGPLDLDEDYQDEVLYVPYVKKDTSANTWTKGGVLRLMTKKDPLPGNWQVSTLIDNNDIGPVTSAVVKINDRTSNKLWAYFGEGRYYYLKSDSSDDPSPSVNRRLFGIKDTCLPKMKMAGTPCSDTVDFSDLFDVTTDPSAPEDPQGWFLSLDPADATAGLNAERDITDPLATSGGVLYFTTYKPYTDLCTLGGKTFIWAMKYNTGGCVNNINGKVLVQVSTGAIQQQDLSQVFGCNPSPPSPDPNLNPPPLNPDPKGGRRTGAMEGKPPEMQGLSVMSAPLGVNRTIHVRER